MMPSDQCSLVRLHPARLEIFVTGHKWSPGHRPQPRTLVAIQVLVPRESEEEAQEVQLESSIWENSEILREILREDA